MTYIMTTPRLPIHANPAEIAYDTTGNPCTMDAHTQAHIVADVVGHNGYTPTITHESACGIDCLLYTSDAADE